LFVDPADEVLRPKLTFNQSFEYPAPGDLENMNVVQAIAYAKETIANDSGAPADKALAYCWLFPPDRRYSPAAEPPMNSS
jgi:hypothetical protein